MDGAALREALQRDGIYAKEAWLRTISRPGLSHEQAYSAAFEAFLQSDIEEAGRACLPSSE